MMIRDSGLLFSATL